MRLADRFYLTAHDDVSGRPRAHSRAIAYGLAELLHERRVTIRHGHVTVVQTPSQDAPTAEILHQMSVEPQHTAVPVGLRFPARDARERVARRLCRQGIVRRQSSRWVIRGAVRYVPTDMNVAAWSWLALVTRLDRRDPLDPLDLALAGLIVTTGPDRHVRGGMPSEVRHRFRQFIDSAGCQIRELLAHTGSASAGGVLAYRSSPEVSDP